MLDPCDGCAYSLEDLPGLVTVLGAGLPWCRSPTDDVQHRRPDARPIVPRRRPHPEIVVARAGRGLGPPGWKRTAIRHRARS